MRRPTFLRVYSSDATEKADEATPINQSEDDVRNSIDNNDRTAGRGSPGATIRGPGLPITSRDHL